jgi:hypothetical protein
MRFLLINFGFGGLFMASVKKLIRIPTAGIDADAIA